MSSGCVGHGRGRPVWAEARRSGPRRAGPDPACGAAHTHSPSPPTHPSVTPLPTLAWPTPLASGSWGTGSAPSELSGLKYVFSRALDTSWYLGEWWERPEGKRGKGEAGGHRAGAPPRPGGLPAAVRQPARQPRPPAQQPPRPPPPCWGPRSTGTRWGSRTPRRTGPGGGGGVRSRHRAPNLLGKEGHAHRWAP